MTSRTTPVGILVIALAGIFAIGCSAQTSAVFEALLDPSSASASAPEADPAADATAESAASGGWWPHSDGYRMRLPAGWVGADVGRPGAAQLMTAMAATNPGLAQRMESVLGKDRTRVTAIAGEPARSAELSPVMLVLTQPLQSKKPHEFKQHVKRQIAQLPGIVASPLPAKDAGLPKAHGWRFDYSINDPDLGMLIVRSYLFDFGPNAYLVNFIATEGQADAAEAVFDAIAESLQFGI